MQAHHGALRVLIMLLNAGRRSSTPVAHSAVAGAPLLVALLGLLAYSSSASTARRLGVFGGFRHGTPLDIGRALFTTYLCLWRRLPS